MDEKERERKLQVFFEDGYTLQDGETVVHFDGKTLKRGDIRAWQVEDDDEKKEAMLDNLIVSAFGLTKTKVKNLAYVDHQVMLSMLYRFIIDPLVLITA